MGGTTAKASLIEDGRVSRSLEYEVGASLSAGSRLLRGSGELIRIPTIDIAEVGAGGGSIAWLDAAEGLHVGPRSAGAAPGPACYGRGGTEPTVTDANVVLGYIPTGPLASGDLTVSRELAEESVRGLGERLGLSTVEAARGIHELANGDDDARPARRLDREGPRPCRLRRSSPTAAPGPVHAAALAAELGVRTAIVPPLAGLFSAAGLLFARAEFHDVRFCRVSAREPDLGVLERLDDEMRAGARRRDRDRTSRSSGSARPTSATAARTGASRSTSPARSTAPALAALVERFEAEHERLTAPGSSPARRSTSGRSA